VTLDTSNGPDANITVTSEAQPMVRAHETYFRFFAEFCGHSVTRVAGRLLGWRTVVMARGAVAYHLGVQRMAELDGQTLFREP
jgi:hypothetical protein